MRKVSLAYISSLLLVTAALAGCASKSDVAEQKPAERVEHVTQYEQYDKVEIALPPGEADATAKFVEPDGDTVVVGAFPDGSDKDGNRRRVRFTPVEVGGYEYTIVEEGGSVLAEGEFRTVASDHPGFVRVDPDGGFPGLEFDDGSPFMLLGENRINIYDPTWNYEKKDIREYVEYMADNGMTTLRVFVFSDCEHEESDDGQQPGCLEPEVGEFDEEVAQRFDEIFEAAEDEGIYVVLVPWAIGFSPEPDTWKSWADNPYNVERGGPAEDRFDFFDDPEVREQAFERIEYVVDRWGYSPNLLAIDLLNEPEWDGEIAETAWTPWARDMAARLERIDPYDHLVTVGPVGLHWNVEGDETKWWADEANDLVQWHRYGPDIYNVHDLAAELTMRVEQTRRYGKPIFCGEFAYGGEGKPYDHTQVGIWSLTMSGAGALAHSAPQFNVDSDHPMTPQRARHFAVLDRFMKPLLTRAPLRADDVVEHPDGTKRWTLRGERAVALWLMDDRKSYGESVTDTTVDLELPAGRWKVEWVDDVTGEIVHTTTVGTFGEAVELQVPEFERHIAARLWKVA
ncbi:DUF4038 domain-containing protein [Persicimonas caeni]|uniref:mannan endo-1,4-beta-mannosidase n=1 Tax=Persicimonas caeni TaxID=2292766 RepID=A0A4Y6PNB2_PERCE|nr:cellulase family glycosylhydrolase [Persicimonas caeni]QDG49507.1 DUF4038 domain-containing protein [Persicimonas caeni]QED30728.1 cellulase family glycosylhydrolase [Persicimonas caeni]